ncbi:hypothetical protein MesoLjLa_69400 (plasmid) [Mesorhizobium sp. L-2-11]|nr:hypothetical protein MesoLjLa_69400 [Mesorhizobium sp. L-2-11]
MRLDSDPRLLKALRDLVELNRDQKIAAGDHVPGFDVNLRDCAPCPGYHVGNDAAIEQNDALTPGMEGEPAKKPPSHRASYEKRECNKQNPRRPRCELDRLVQMLRITKGTWALCARRHRFQHFLSPGS